jgi:hypothetical protein
MNNEIKTIEQLNAAIDALPELSKKLYFACVSSIESEEEASGEVKTGSFYLDNAYADAGISPKQASGIFSHLSKVGLYEEHCTCFGLIKTDEI